MIISAIYAAILIFFTFGILKLDKPKKREPKFLSVIVAARNEEEFLPKLISNMRKQNYPQNMFEIIFVNDRSTDNTENIIIRALDYFENASYVKVESEKTNLIGKKNAINEGIKKAKSDILVFTDADCAPQKSWLSQINNHYDEKTDFVAGFASIYNKDKNNEKHLRNMERIAFSSISAGALGWQWGISCSAGNLSYRKTLFEKVNGFDGIGHIRSGDDDLMLFKMSKKIRKKNYMLRKESVMPTYDECKLKTRIHKETRRSSKWKYYPKRLKILTAFFLIYYIFFSYLLVQTLTGKISLNLFLTHFYLKATSEFLMYSTFATLIKNKKMILLFPLIEIFYIPFFIFFGIKGTFGKYKWKN